MGNVNEFAGIHGCACGGRGRIVARRPPHNTREWEADIQHERGEIHINLMKHGEKPRLKENYDLGR